MRPDDVDGNIFKHAEHGLGADLIKLFQMVADMTPFSEAQNLLLPDSVVIDGRWERLEITYKNLVPVLRRCDK